MKLAIGEKIALLRKKRNVTQTELAEYLYLTPQTVSRWEVGSGTPEVTLLPRIATFFGVSIDELFGVTSLERTEDLAVKYSILRDDSSLREAMEQLDSQLQTVDAALSGGLGDVETLMRDRDKLESLKIHVLINQGREAFKRAYEITDRFVQKTEGHPEHPWYLPMRMERDHLSLHIGRGRETLEERRRELAGHPDEVTLQRCLNILLNAERYEEVLAVYEEAEGPIRELLDPPTEKNLGMWEPILDAAFYLSRKDFVEQYLPPVLEVCNEESEFFFLLSLRKLYRVEGQVEKAAALKERLLYLLPRLSFCQIEEDLYRKQIEECGP